MIDANNSASTAGKSLGGNQDSKTGDGENGIETAMKKVFAGTWFPEVDNEEVLDNDECDFAQMLVNDEEGIEALA